MVAASSGAVAVASSGSVVVASSGSVVPSGSVVAASSGAVAVASSGSVVVANSGCGGDRRVGIRDALFWDRLLVARLNSLHQAGGGALGHARPVDSGQDFL